MPTKPTRFLRSEADRRALKLYAALREMEQMPLICFEIRDNESKPILVWDKNDPKAWSKWSVDSLLMRDIGKAKQAGGRYEDLLNARKAPPRPRVSQAEVERAYKAFVTGEEEDVPPE